MPARFWCSAASATLPSFAFSSDSFTSSCTHRASAASCRVKRWVKEGGQNKGKEGQPLKQLLSQWTHQLSEAIVSQLRLTGRDLQCAQTHSLTDRSYNFSSNPGTGTVRSDNVNERL